MRSEHFLVGSALAVNGDIPLVVGEVRSRAMMRSRCGLILRGLTVGTPGFPAAQLETVFLLWGESSVAGTQTRNRPVCSLGGARGVQLAEPERGSEAGYKVRVAVFGQSARCLN